MNIENLFLSGGGNSIYATVKELRVLEYKGILTHLKRLGGSSAGAGLCGLLAVGFTVDEIITELLNVDVSTFLDGYINSYIGEFFRTIFHSGAYHGDELFNWYGSLLFKKTNNADITFEEVYKIYGIELVITGTCVNQHETHFYHHVSNPRMPIRKAVSISSRMPGVFKPTLWDVDHLIDGGFSNNYPIWIFDRDLKEYNSKVREVYRDTKLNEKTIGIYITGQKNKSVIKSNMDYISAIIKTWKRVLDNMIRHDPDISKQTIFITLPEDQTFNFNISKNERFKLMHYLANEKSPTLEFLKLRKNQEVIKLLELI